MASAQLRTPRASESIRPAPASAADHARALLQRWGRASCVPAEPGAAPHPDVAWARSGAMALCGEADGPPLLAPGPFAQRMAGALMALAALAPPGDRERLRAIDGAALLGERAAVAGLGRRGRIAPGGSCRLLRARDGGLALNLAREDDVALLEAWLEAVRPEHQSAWDFAAHHCARADLAALVARGRLIGLALAAALPPRSRPPDWLQRRALAARRRRQPDARPLVLDLSSLWAGPLCGHLLERAGARVIKLESRRRPDGARRGPRAFFDLLNAGKQSVALDLGDATDLRRLRALIERADIVIESARPRALRQLGVLAEDCVARRPGQTWIAITGHGRGEPEAGWVAFGDDAAVAAGVAACFGPGLGGPLFCGDALADPLSGAHAAVAALASYRDGGGELIELSLRDVTEHVLGCDPEGSAQPLRGASAVADGADFAIEIGGEPHAVAPPRARAPHAAAPALGADSAAVLRELAEER